MCSDRPVVALVDAYGSGRYLQQACAALGADTVHVWSTPAPLTSMAPPDLAAYRASIVCADPAETARELRALGATAVVAGQEPGVPLADTLSEMLALPTNGTALSAARRDKYLMIEAVRAAGLHCAEQFRSGDIDAVVAWARRLGRYPVVVKPLAASGSQGVAICADAGQVRRAAREVIGTTTMYGQANTEVLAQSYLAGTEYVVDTVSGDGGCYVSAVWRYEKHRCGERNLYHLKVLVSPDDPVVPTLTAYVTEVHRALGIRFGAAHAEVMLTEDGPALVEIGARMTGSVRPEFDRECCGADQAAVSALAHCRPAEFAARFAGRCYTKRRETFLHFATTDLDGTLAGFDEELLAEIDALASVRLRVPKVRPGDRIRPTRDLPSSPMTVHMCNASLAELVRDYHRVRELGKRLYVLENTKQEAIMCS